MPYAVVRLTLSQFALPKSVRLHHCQFSRFKRQHCPRLVRKAALSSKFLTRGPVSTNGGPSVDNF